MKIKVLTEREVKTVHVMAKVRYWEDSRVNGVKDEAGELIPCREGEYWKPIIDLESGKILNWKHGTVADVHYKVCDAGIYTLKDEAGNIVKEIDGYVPQIMYPEENGYGDYIIMMVDENGVIANWKVNLSEFDDEDAE